MKLNVSDGEGAPLWGHRFESDEVHDQLLADVSINAAITGRRATIRPELTFFFGEGLSYLADGENLILGRVRFAHNDSADWTLIAQREGDDVRLFYKLEVRRENGNLLDQDISWGTELSYDDYSAANKIVVPLDFISFPHVNEDEVSNIIGILYEKFDVFTETGAIGDSELVSVSYETLMSPVVPMEEPFDHPLLGDVIEDHVTGGRVLVSTDWSVEDVGDGTYLSKVTLEAEDIENGEIVTLTEESIVPNVEKFLSDSVVDLVRLSVPEEPLSQLHTLTESSLERILPHEVVDKQETLAFLDRIYLEEVSVEQIDGGHYVTGAEGSRMGFVESDVHHELSENFDLMVEGRPESRHAEINLTDPSQEESMVSLTHYEKGALGDKFPIISLVSSLVSYGGLTSLFLLYHHFFKKKKEKKIKTTVQFLSSSCVIISVIVYPFA